MITPLDIQNKAFGKGVRGYREEEVDSFLDVITLDLEKLMNENAQLKKQVAQLSGELQRYKGSEGAVLETLEAAKALMSDISASSEKRAEILLKNAELDAELITREAKESVERLKEEGASLESKVSSFRMRYRNLLETELEKFDSLTQELFEEMQMERWRQPAVRSGEKEGTKIMSAVSPKGADEEKGGSDEQSPLLDSTGKTKAGQESDMARTMLNLRMRED